MCVVCSSPSCPQGFYLHGSLSLSLCVYHNYCIYDDDSVYAEMRKKISSSSKLRSIHHAMMPWLTQYVTIIHLVRYYIHAIRVCFFIIIHTVNTLLVDATRSRFSCHKVLASFHDIITDSANIQGCSRRGPRLNYWSARSRACTPKTLASI